MDTETINQDNNIAKDVNENNFGKKVISNKNIFIIFALIGLIILGSIGIFWYKINNIKSSSIIENKIANKTIVRMVQPVWPGFMFPALSHSLGYMQEEGIYLSFVNISDEMDTFDAMEEGLIDVRGALSTQQIARIKQTGVIDSKIVLVTDYSVGGDALLKRKDAPMLQDNKLKKVSGIEDYGFFIPYAFDVLKANMDSIKYVKVISDEERIKKLISGEIDYAATYEPYLTEAINQGAEVVYSSADQQGVLTDVLVFSNKFIDENPKVVVRFMRAYFKAYEYWMNNPKDAYSKLSKFYTDNPEDFFKLTEKIKLLGYEDNINAMSAHAGLNSIYGNLQMTQLYEKEMEGKELLDVGKLIYPNALREIEKEKRMSNK